jgi:hypothetical protein
MSTTEELLDRKVAAPVYKTENTTVGIRHADHVATLYPQKLAITSPTSGGRSVAIVRSRTQTMEFCLFVFYLFIYYIPFIRCFLTSISFSLLSLFPSFSTVSSPTYGYKRQLQPSSSIHKNRDICVEVY